MTEMETKKISRSTDDIFIVECDEEEKFRQENYADITKYIEDAADKGVIRCTVCSENISFTQALPHPALRVLLCVSCNSKYEKRFSPNNETNNNCRWCSEPVTNYNCSYCTCVFCEQCVRINFDPVFLSKVKAKWNCFICDPKQLWWLRAICAAVMDRSINIRRNIPIAEEAPSTSTSSLELSQSSISQSPLLQSPLSQSPIKNSNISPEQSKATFQRCISLPSQEYYSQNSLSDSCSQESSFQSDDLTFLRSQRSDCLNTLYRIKLNVDGYLNRFKRSWDDCCEEFDTKDYSLNTEKFFNTITKFCEHVSADFNWLRDLIEQEKTCLYRRKNLIQEDLNKSCDRIFVDNSPKIAQNDKCLKRRHSEPDILPSSESTELPEEDNNHKTKKICLSSKKPDPNPHDVSTENNSSITKDNCTETNKLETPTIKQEIMDYTEDHGAILNNHEDMYSDIGTGDLHLSESEFMNDVESGESILATNTNEAISKKSNLELVSKKSEVNNNKARDGNIATNSKVPDTSEKNQPLVDKNNINDKQNASKKDKEASGKENKIKTDVKEDKKPTKESKNIKPQEIRSKEGNLQSEPVKPERGQSSEENINGTQITNDAMYTEILLSKVKIEKDSNMESVPLVLPCNGLENAYIQQQKSDELQQNVQYKEKEFVPLNEQNGEINLSTNEQMCNNLDQKIKPSCSDQKELSKKEDLCETKKNIDNKTKEKLKEDLIIGECSSNNKPSTSKKKLEEHKTKNADTPKDRKSEDKKQKINNKDSSSKDNKKVQERRSSKEHIETVKKEKKSEDSKARVEKDLKRSNSHSPVDKKGRSSDDRRKSKDDDKHRSNSKKTIDYVKNEDKTSKKISKRQEDADRSKEKNKKEEHKKYEAKTVNDRRSSKEAKTKDKNRTSKEDSPPRKTDKEKCNVHVNNIEEQNNEAEKNENKAKEDPHKRKIEDNNKKTKEMHRHETEEQSNEAEKDSKYNGIDENIDNQNTNVKKQDSIEEMCKKIMKEWDERSKSFPKTSPKPENEKNPPVLELTEEVLRKSSKELESNLQIIENMYDNFVREEEDINKLPEITNTETIANEENSSELTNQGESKNKSSKITKPNLSETNQVPTVNQDQSPENIVIKTELQDYEDNASNFSNETQILNLKNTTDNTIASADTLSFNLNDIQMEANKRILEDFSDEKETENVDKNSKKNTQIVEEVEKNVTNVKKETIIPNEIFSISTQILNIEEVPRKQNDLEKLTAEVSEENIKSVTVKTEIIVDTQITKELTNDHINSEPILNSIKIEKDCYIVSVPIVLPSNEMENLYIKQEPVEQPKEISQNQTNDKQNKIDLVSIKLEPDQEIKTYTNVFDGIIKKEPNENTEKEQGLQVDVEEPEFSYDDIEMAYLDIKFGSPRTYTNSESSHDSLDDVLPSSSSFQISDPILIVDDFEKKMNEIMSGTYKFNNATISVVRSEEELSVDKSEENMKSCYIDMMGSQEVVWKWLRDNNVTAEQKEEMEINRLINLDSLERGPRESSSATPHKKKRKKTSKDTVNTSSTLSSISNENRLSDFDDNSSEPTSPKKTETVQKEDLAVSSDGSLSEDETEKKEKEDPEKTKKKKKDDPIDEDESSRDSKRKRKRDSLLNVNLNSDSDEQEKQEESECDNQNDAENKSKGKGKKLRKNSGSSTKSISDISISSDSDDSVQFISEDTEEAAGTSKSKRRNIREVLSDDVLQEATKQALREEESRKLRLSQKQITLDTVLSQASHSQEETGLVLDIDENNQALVTVSHKLDKELKPHQRDGIKFMWEMCFESVEHMKKNSGAGCILAHCMGLGKTRQVIVLAQTLLSHKILNIKHILVLCPLSTVSNWRNEHMITLQVLPFLERINFFDLLRNYSTRKKFEYIKKWRQGGGLLVMGYEAFQTLLACKRRSASDQTFLEQSLISPGADVIICDEGHMLKNGKTSRCKAVTKVETKRRIILTGTPLQNNLKEYYQMVNFVKPNLLGTEQEYNNRFVNPILNGQFEDSGPEDISLMRKRAHVLHKKLETTVQRFESSELEQYMPPKKDYVIFIKLSPLQTTLYQKYLEKIDEISYATMKQKSLFQNFHSLQYIWTHPAILESNCKRKQSTSKNRTVTYDVDFVMPEIDPDNLDQNRNFIDATWFKNMMPSDLKTNITYGPKIEILFSIIKECSIVGDKLLVFSASILELDLIEEFLKEVSRRDRVSWVKNRDYFRMDGAVEPEKRMSYCTRFNNVEDRNARLFLISHKVGGLGLNLFAANRVVLMDVNWNPTHDQQSIYRIFRFGQEKSCFVYRLVAMGTMEEVVYSRGVTKLAISARVVDEQQICRNFKSDDLQRMYRLELHNEPRPTPQVPEDRLLAKLLNKFNPTLYKYCEHQTLLENLPHEQLNEEDRKAAWEEFQREEEMAKFQKMLPVYPSNHDIQNYNGYNTNQEPLNLSVENMNYYQNVNKQRFMKNRRGLTGGFVVQTNEQNAGVSTNYTNSNYNYGSSEVNNQYRYQTPNQYQVPNEYNSNMYGNFSDMYTGHYPYPRYSLPTTSATNSLMNLQEQYKKVFGQFMQKNSENNHGTSSVYSPVTSTNNYPSTSTAHRNIVTITLEDDPRETSNINHLANNQMQQIKTTPVPVLIPVTIHKTLPTATIVSGQKNSTTQVNSEVNKPTNMSTNRGTIETTTVSSSKPSTSTGAGTSYTGNVISIISTGVRTSTSTDTNRIPTPSTSGINKSITTATAINKSTIVGNTSSGASISTSTATNPTTSVVPTTLSGPHTSVAKTSTTPTTTATSSVPVTASSSATATSLASTSSSSAVQNGNRPYTPYRYRSLPYHVSAGTRPSGSNYYPNSSAPRPLFPREQQRYRGHPPRGFVTKSTTQVRHGFQNRRPHPYENYYHGRNFEI